jgi:hypothetical protein
MLIVFLTVCINKSYISKGEHMMAHYAVKTVNLLFGQKTFTIALSLLIILIMLSTLHAVSGQTSNNSQIIIPIPALDIPFEKDSNGTVRFKGESVYGNPGQPGLPRKILTLLLPPNADLQSVKVSIENESVKVVEDKCNVAPIADIRPSCNNPSVSQTNNIVNHQDGGVLPTQWIGKVSSGQLRQWRLVDIEYYPFQYNPASEKLSSLDSGNLVVTFNNLQVATSAGLDALSSKVQGEIRKKVLNFKDVSPAYSLLEPQANQTIKPHYVIITTSAIQSASNQLINFIASKRARGFEVEVIMENTWGGGIGDVAANNIRRWLRSNYQVRNLQYVLLIGNPNPVSGDVPMKMTYPRSEATENRDTPTDYYYAELTGNWDLDGDNLFGEYNGDYGLGGADRNTEVIVGRIPYYGVIADLDSILTKLITYGNASITEATWRKRALLTMKPSDPTTPGYHLGEAIKNQVLLNKGWKFYRIYDENYDLMPLPEMTPCTFANVKNAWLSVPTGAVFWWTHGGNTSASEVINVETTPQLNNMYPAFTFQSSCYNSIPEITNNLSYELLRNGAINPIGATRVSWYSVGQTMFENTPSNTGMTLEYARRLIEDEMPSGDALQDLKFDIEPGNSWFWMNYLDFNIYGDPSIGPYTFNPGNSLTVEIPSTVFEGDGLLSAKGIVRIPQTMNSDLTISLESSDTSEIMVVATVRVKAGESFAVFDLDIKDDNDVDGEQSVRITASALGYTLGSALIRVEDDGDAPIGPIAHWQFDEATGSTAIDISGNGYNAIIDGPTWTTGKLGRAISFDGTNDYIDIPIAIGVNSNLDSSQGAISLWVKTDKDFTDIGNIFYTSSASNGNGLGPEDELHINFTSDEKLQFFIEGGNTDVNIKSSQSYSNNIWHHVVAMWDISGNAVLYIDGLNVGSAQHDANNFSFSNVIRLGGARTSKRYYTGAIDQLRIYNRTLTPLEVGALYREGINSPPKVSITSPSSGSNFALKANINIEAKASDTDGVIRRVEFYQGATLIGTDTSTPYSVTWSNVMQGSYSLTARSYDELNRFTLSKPVRITVGNQTILIDENCSTLTNFTKVRGGNWSSSDGRCVLTNAATSCTGPLCNLLIQNTSVNVDFNMTVQAIAVGSAGVWDDFAIIFGYKDVNNYYFASFNESDNNGTNGLFRVQDGITTELKNFIETTTASGKSLHAIRIEKNGNSVRVSRGNILLGEIMETAIRIGKVGFGTANNSVTLDNLKVIKR